MSGEISKAAAEAGAKAAMDLSFSGAGFSVSLKIDNVWLDGAVSIGALSLGAFYLARRGPAEDAIKRALERKAFGNKDPEVAQITDGHSILVELQCHTDTSLLLFLEDVETKTVKFRLEEEFKKIGFKEELDVSIRNAEKVKEYAIQIRERFKAGQKDVNQNKDWKQKYQELAEVTDKIYEMQALALHLTERPTTIPSTKEPSKRLQDLATLFNELTQRERCINDSGKHGDLEVLQSKDLLDLRTELAISKGLQGAIENLQVENKALAKTAKHERVEERKVVTRDIPELREKVHELEKGKEWSQQKLTKKVNELERFLGQDKEAIRIIEEPSSQKIKEGSKVELVFKRKAPGKSKLTYQWYKDGAELQGKDEGTLVLNCVTLPDFGLYNCVASCEDSSIDTWLAELNVSPRDGTRLKYLREVDLDTRDKIAILLEDETPGLGGYRQLAVNYGMEEYLVRGLKFSRQPGQDFLEFLWGSNPDLTVYSFCKKLKEDNMKRFDIVKALDYHLSIEKESK